MRAAGPVAWSGRLGAGILLVALCLAGLGLVSVRLAEGVPGQYGVFLLVSASLAGLAPGGLVALLAPGWSDRAPLRRAALLLALSVLGVWAVLRLPGGAAVGGSPALLALLCAVPFLVGGFVPALLLARFSQLATRLCAWGLVGAGVGCLAAPLFLDRFGPLGALCALAVPAAAAAPCFGGPGPGKRGMAAALLLAALSVAAALERQGGPTVVPRVEATTGGGAGFRAPGGTAPDRSLADLRSLPHRLREAPGTLIAGADRGTLRRDRSRHDVIEATAAPFTPTGHPAYTVEAVHEYLDHLEPGGVVAISGVLPRPHLRRVAATVRAALRERGADLPASRVFIAASGDRATLLVKERPYTTGEVLALEESSRALGLEVLFAPGRQAGAPFDGLLRGVRTGKDAPSPGEDATPITDDRPFLDAPLRAGELLGPAAAGAREDCGGVTLRELRWLLAFVTGVAALVLAFPAVAHGPGRGWGLRAVVPAAYFAAVGFGSTAVGITLFRRALTLLGSPSLAVAAALCVPLLAGGLGSWRAGGFGGRPAAVRRRCALAVVVLMLTAVLLPVLVELALGAALPARALATAVVLAPLGYLLAQPFPLGLLLVRERDGRLAPWCWSVLVGLAAAGAGAALLLPLAAGYTTTLMAGPAAFLVAGVLAEDL